MKTLRVVAIAVLGSFLLQCASAPSPEPAPEVVDDAGAVPEVEPPIGTVRVTASKLNVRSEPSTTATAVGEVRKGNKLALLRTEGEWSRVRLTSGTTGWVATKFVTPDRKCPPDSDVRFAKAPVPRVSENSPPGNVVVEATIDTAGRVLGTRIVSNTTLDPTLGKSVESEIRSAVFLPLVRNCKPKSFIYVYRRSF